MDTEESRVAIYARVSSNRQEREHTVESQLAELRSAATAAGYPNPGEYVDEGYSRSELARPRLDSLRDAAREGTIDRIFVHAPDRLGSGTALLVLYDEFTNQDVEVVFLHGEIEDTAEGRLLLHVQAGVGDFERAKTAERTRRGKLHWAKQGNVPVGVRAYGYEMILRSGETRARLRVNEGQAAIVRLMFRLLVDEGKSLRAIADELTLRRIATPRGAPRWRPTTVRNILRNRIYAGELRFRQSSKKRRRGMEHSDESTVMIPVELVIDDSTWRAAQDQLDQNYEQAKRNNHVNFYLLRGLIRCHRCGGKYSGQAKNGTLHYRCANYDASISGSGTRCQSGSFAAAPVEDAVWEAVTGMLADPVMVREEMERRVHESSDAAAVASGVKALRRSVKTIGQQQDRLTDAYVAGAIDLESFKARMDGLAAQQAELQDQIEASQRSEETAAALRTAAEAFEEFASSVRSGIDSLSDEERQRLLQLLVEEVKIEGDTVTISTVIEPARPSGRPGSLRTRHPELDSASP